MLSEGNTMEEMEYFMALLGEEDAKEMMLGLVAMAERDRMMGMEDMIDMDHTMAMDISNNSMGMEDTMDMDMDISNIYTKFLDFDSLPLPSAPTVSGDFRDQGGTMLKNNITD
jgi:hypothetical protein